MSAEVDAATARNEEQQVTFNIKAANDQKFVLTLPATTTVGDIKAKLSTSEYADLPVERIRLIYSGRVLKDIDTLGATKIKDGHTIHMVKGAASNARQNPAAQSATSGTAGSTPSAAPAANVPQNLATGTGNNPLAQLTGARYAGFHGLPSASMFGADGGMGPPPGPDEMLRMLDDPNFVQQMSEMMNSPHFQQILEQSPAFRDNPMARQMFRDPNMRRLMLDPNMLRLQLQMQRSMGGGGDGGSGSFPAPGVTNTTPQQAGTTDSAANVGAAGGAAAASPFASLFGNAGAGGQANPFAALLGTPPPPSGANTGQPAATEGTTNANPGPPGNQENAWAQMAAAMSAMGAMQGGQSDEGGAAGNPFANLFGGGGFGGMPQQPPDNRPPEERYADQLRQLNDMGFFDFDRNVQALRRSGGSVQGAIEHLLSGP